MAFKLGKLAPKYNPKTLRLARFLVPGILPPPPEKAYFEYKVDPAKIGMYLNDQIGDCTCAEVAHHLMLITAHTGHVVVPNNAEVRAMYSAISGYDPETGANDNGAAITDALNYWQTVGLAGHKILGWASIDPRNRQHRNLGVYLFGGNSIGIQCPASAQDQFPTPWEVVADDGGIEGGHCIMESGYGAAGRNFETWGKGDQKASNAWDDKYVDEAYCVITQELLEFNAGFGTKFVDVDAMRVALKAVAA